MPGQKAAGLPQTPRVDLRYKLGSPAGPGNGERLEIGHEQLVGKDDAGQKKPGQQKDAVEFAHLTCGNPTRSRSEEEHGGEHDEEVEDRRHESTHGEYTPPLRFQKMIDVSESPEFGFQMIRRCRALCVTCELALLS